MKITFCCTGNTCRSPIAEFLLKQYIKENNIKNLEVDSCGIMCPNNEDIAEFSSQVLTEIGVDSSSHSSRSITVMEIMKSDYIITMTQRHVLVLRELFNAGENVLSLGSLVGMGDVDDPYNKDINEYRKCRELLKTMIDALVKTPLLANNIL